MKGWGGGVLGENRQSERERKRWREKRREEEGDRDKRRERRERKRKWAGKKEAVCVWGEKGILQ